jgi:hypothetical protein
MHAPKQTIATDQNLLSLICLQLMLLMGAVLLGFALSTDRVVAVLNASDPRSVLGLGLLLLSSLAVYRCLTGSRAKALMQTQLVLFSGCMAALLMVGVNAFGGGLLQGRGVIATALLCAALAMLITRALKQRVDSGLAPVAPKHIEN